MLLVGYRYTTAVWPWDFLGPFFELGGKRFVLRLNQLDVPQETGAQVVLKVTFSQFAEKSFFLPTKSKFREDVPCNLSAGG